MKPSPTMYLVYIDESYDISHFAYAALMVPAFEWNSIFQAVREWRQQLFNQHAIPLDYELHATDFVAGRGEPQENRDKEFRAARFTEVFDLVNHLQTPIIVTGVVGDKKGHLDLFEELLLTIASILLKENACAVLICDEGNERTLTSLARKIKKSGPRIDSILEDPLFKTSKSSYFLQLADFIAFATLRNKKPAASTRAEITSAIGKIKKQVSVYPGLGSEPPAGRNITNI